MAAASTPLLPFPKLLKCHSPRRLPPPPAAAASPGSAALRAVFACGGSGGHIFPAIAIADELRIASPGAEIVFVGADAGMETEIVPASGYGFIAAPKVRLVRPFLSPLNLLLPFKLLGSVAACCWILRRLNPDVVVGTGAYASAPACFAAALIGMRLVIQEQNCSPGITNRALAPYADKIFVAFNACLEFFPREKCVVCGNPIKFSVASVSKAEAGMHFFSDEIAGGVGAQVVLVLGGSTGANAINSVFLNMCYEMLSVVENRFIIWQTGAEWYEEVKSVVRDHPRLLLAPFLDAMDLAYAAADVVVSRAGAMTCTEILLTGKPSILIPSPTAAEDHQTKNAYMMADLAGSKVIIEDELDSSNLAAAIIEILGDVNLMAEMGGKAKRAARPNASSDIVQFILSLVNSPAT